MCASVIDCPRETSTNTIFFGFAHLVFCARSSAPSSLYFAISYGVRGCRIYCFRSAWIDQPKIDMVFLATEVYVYARIWTDRGGKWANISISNVRYSITALRMRTWNLKLPTHTVITAASVSSWCSTAHLLGLIWNVGTQFILIENNVAQYPSLLRGSARTRNFQRYGMTIDGHEGALLFWFTMVCVSGFWVDYSEKIATFSVVGNENHVWPQLMAVSHVVAIMMTMIKQDKKVCNLIWIPLLISQYSMEKLDVSRTLWSLQSNNRRICSQSIDRSKSN